MSPRLWHAVLLFATSQVISLPAAPTAEEREALVKAAAALPVQAFFDHPEVIKPILSPDGSKIAFLFPLEGRRALGVFERTTGEARMVLRAKNESLDSLAWKGNEHVIVFADFHGNLTPDIILTDLTGKKPVKLNNRHGVRGIIDIRPFDPERIMAVGIFSGAGYENVSLLNVFTGRATEVFKRPEGDYNSGYGGIVADREGNVRFMSRVQKKEVSLHYRPEAKQPFAPVISWPVHGYAEQVEDIRISGDGNTAYIVARTEHDRGALHTFDLAKRQWGPVIFIPPEGDIESLHFSPDRTRFHGVTYAGARRHYHWFDGERATLQASLEDAFPGLEVEVVSTSVDEKVMLVLVHSDREPGTYFLLDREAKTMAMFKRRMPLLDTRLLRPMEPVAFAARDDVGLQGYLTRPWASADGRPSPLIIVPHGGPFGFRDTWGFDPEAQFLASRGYAVLQINYRGSGGFGRAFVDQGRYQWGRAMQDDLTDGVAWAVAQGYADPKRVGIYGASYGGYAALAGVTLTPDIYRCAVNYVGPTDLEITFHERGSDAYLRKGDFNHRNEWVGASKDHRLATSPIRFIDRIRAPTFHVYGKNDPIVDFEHWVRLKRELDRHAKPYEFMVEKDQGHGFDSGRASIEFYQRMEKFLAIHLAAP